MKRSGLIFVIENLTRLQNCNLPIPDQLLQSGNRPASAQSSVAVRGDLVAVADLRNRLLIRQLEVLDQIGLKLLFGNRTASSLIHLEPEFADPH